MSPIGTAPDYERSNAANRFLVRDATPYSLTAVGYATALLNAAAKDATEATLFTFNHARPDRPIIGMRFKKENGDTVTIFVNASTEDIAIQSEGVVTRFKSEPWKAVYDQQHVTRVEGQTSGNVVELPAFSIALVEASSNRTKISLGL